MELFRSLAALAEPPTRETRQVADALNLGAVPQASDYDDLFLFQLYPFASVYLGAEGMLGGEARDRIAGFWRALDQSPPVEPDHLAVMLAFYARVLDFEADCDHGSPRAQHWRHVRTSFLWEHLLSWLPPFLDKLEEVGSQFYRAWGRLLTAALRREVAEVGQVEKLPLHLREAPPLADPETEGGEALLDSLLSPARSGIIVVRSDLHRAARDLDLGSRIAERRYALKALLGQDAGATLGWLQQEASLWTERHRRWQPLAGIVAQYWVERAAATAAFLARVRS
jgi:TorA maturation chaperone TorD